MTNSNERFDELNDRHSLAALAAIDAMIDTLLLANELDDSTDRIIDSATFILEITDPDPHDMLENAINHLAFDCLDLDDDMLIERIQSRIDAL